MAQSILSVRVEEDTKQNFDRFCNSVGLNPSVAINMFIKATLRERKIPFEISDGLLKREPYTDLEAMEALQEAIELENNPSTKRYNSSKAMREAILSGDDDD